MSCVFFPVIAYWNRPTNTWVVLQGGPSSPKCRFLYPYETRGEITPTNLPIFFLGPKNNSPLITGNLGYISSHRNVSIFQVVNIACSRCGSVAPWRKESPLRPTTPTSDRPLHPTRPTGNWTPCASRCCRKSPPRCNVTRWRSFSPD